MALVAPIDDSFLSIGRQLTIFLDNLVAFSTIGYEIFQSYLKDTARIQGYG